MLRGEAIYGRWSGNNLVTRQIAIYGGVRGTNVVTAVLGVAFILVRTATSCNTNYYSVGPHNVVCAEFIARFAVYGNSTPTLHTHHNTTHISVAGSHLDVMLTGGPTMFPGVCGGCPSPPPPPSPAAAVRWLWLRVREHQEATLKNWRTGKRLEEGDGLQLSSSWGAITVQYFTVNILHTFLHKHSTHIRTSQ